VHVGQIHDFQLAAPVVPEATRLVRQIGEYMRRHADVVSCCRRIQAE
jgi:hypothetical protein